MWYTDGCPIFKSSKVSLWPLFFAINELPYTKRFRKDNLVYAGLWLGQNPAMATFLKPFHQSLQELMTGIFVEVPSCKFTSHFKGHGIVWNLRSPRKMFNVEHAPV